MLHFLFLKHILFKPFQLHLTMCAFLYLSSCLFHFQFLNLIKTGDSKNHNSFNAKPAFYGPI
jgi:hypothetical protein